MDDQQTKPRGRSSVTEENSGGRRNPFDGDTVEVSELEMEDDLRSLITWRVSPDKRILEPN